MANQEQLDILNQGVDTWNTWRKDNPDEVIDLVNADLQDAYLHSANLQGANLSAATLKFANLINAYLGSSILMNTHLEYANLTSADLRAAMLQYTRLGSANLTSADMGDAHLESANLESANLTGTNLIGANLAYARMGGTILAQIDLSQTDGLDTVWHMYASEIGINTLYASKGKIPEVFLRGCGVPEVMINYLPSLMENAFDFYSCFINHNHTDKPLARRIHDRLQGEGIRCWLDEKQLNPGESIYDGVSHGIKVWDKTIVLFSEHSLKSWWVDYEIDKAFQKERELFKQYGKKIHALIPLDLDGKIFSDEYRSGKIEEITNSRIVANFKAWESDNNLFEREIARVINALRTDGGKSPDPEPKLGKEVRPG